MHVHGESPRGSSLIPVKSWILTSVCRQYAAEYNREVVRKQMREKYCSFAQPDNGSGPNQAGSYCLARTVNGRPCSDDYMGWANGTGRNVRRERA